MVSAALQLGLAGKTALICASTSGLGRATARALAEEGVTVVVTGRSGERAKEVAGELPGAVGVGCDLVADGGAERLLTAAREAVGDLDILVLNGPGPTPGPARAIDTAGVEQAIATLVTPQQILVRGTLPAMVEKGWGRILSISSTSVQAPLPNLSLSNLGRAALARYLKTLAAEVAAHGVTVNSCFPAASPPRAPGRSTRPPPGAPVSRPTRSRPRPRPRFYIVSVFVLSYGPSHLGLSRSVLLTGMLIAAVAEALTVPCFGALSAVPRERPVHRYVDRLSARRCRGRVRAARGGRTRGRGRLPTAPRGRSPPSGRERR
ncbi:SDR family NAD(P)-dependent oxidoreductase [Streptomyces sp. 4503]|uniref:SDR family NAD(P)-dependent oxidoreductase n=1 Tax=Streptomyces niphimycinicus TaxID=2842201 RepID=A0ABS6CFD6_9ACTN|nr:SDR family NAD(P)-dependent oxidoreductase [Streptomyces niphimycinicus]MBU3865611.1 SDR family NAD(P)-dependent oxidoreductase [Streptomyces niphimycinicus]